MKKTTLQRALVAISSLAVLAFGLGILIGCAGSAEGATGAAEEATEVQVVEFGTESATAIKLDVTNGTGKDIDNIQIKTAQDADYQPPLANEGNKLIADGQAVIYFEPTVVDPAVVGEDGGDNVPVQLYNLWLAFSDTSSLEIFNLDLAGLESLTLRISEDGLGYVEYQSISGETGDTLEAERTRLAEVAAAAAAEEEARLAAEAEAAAAAEAEAAAQAQSANQYDYGSGSGSGSSGGGSSDTSSSSGSSYEGQSEDGCVDDLAFR